ncbi:hypothetical protein J6590_010414 [Homalodisca vitripennis]|nr:hypothetical protein J6590_010414 [Homalodisca vitripennis]
MTGIDLLVAFQGGNVEDVSYHNNVCRFSSEKSIYSSAVCVRGSMGMWTVDVSGWWVASGRGGGDSRAGPRHYTNGCGPALSVCVCAICQALAVYCTCTCASGHLCAPLPLPSHCAPLC